MTETDKKLIVSFVSSDMFEAVKKVADERIEKIRGENPKKETEFETIYNLGLLQGRQSELTEFFRTLELICGRLTK